MILHFTLLCQFWTEGEKSKAKAKKGLETAFPILYNHAYWLEVVYPANL